MIHSLMRLNCINSFYGGQIKIILLGVTDNTTPIRYFPCHKKELNSLDYKSFILQIMSVKQKHTKTLDIKFLPTCASSKTHKGERVQNRF